MNASMKQRCVIGFVFDVLYSLVEKLGGARVSRNPAASFRGTIYIDPIIPLEEALNQWLHDRQRGELLKAGSRNPQHALFVESVIFINKEENRYQDSRRNRRLLSHSRRELNLEVNL